MPAQIQDTGIVETTPQDLPVLAVNVLERLGYRVSRASKQLDQILATERLDEQVGRDWWRHDYAVVLRWRNALQTNGVLVSLEITERKGTGSQADCQKRSDRIFMELIHDAKRAYAAGAEKEKNTSCGAARWGTEDELRESGYLVQRPEPKRLILGKLDTGEYLQIPELLSYAHAIVCGRTGVGKSRGFFIPQLIERTGTSMIVTEATPGEEPGELYQLTSGWRRTAGHQIYCFNPSDMTSHRINPIDRVRRAPDDRKAKIAERLADLLILNGEREGSKIDPTWDKSEKLLLTPLILHAAAADPKYGHFGAIRWLLLSGLKRLRQVMKASPSQLAQMEFEGWLQLTGENFRFGVMSGLLTKLNPWMTDQMIALTETTDVDLDSLHQQLFTFYLAVPSRSRDSKLIGSLMVNFLLDHILEMRQHMVNPLAMLLDEFTNFGKIAGIGDVLSIIRKAKIALVLGFQNYYQLEQVYGRREAQIILDQPATQIYFKQKTYREARELSEALGRMTVEETTITDAGRVQDMVRARALATPDELINLKDEVIVFTPTTWPLKLPLFAPTVYNAALSYEPPERPAHEISEFIKRRGRKDAFQVPEKSEPSPPSRDVERLISGRDAPRSLQRSLPQTGLENNTALPPSMDDDRAPDQGDVWEL